MLHAAFQLRAHAVRSDGDATDARFTERTHLEQRARQLVARGGEESEEYAAIREQLDGPPAPAHSRHLLAHARALIGRSGSGVDGPNALAWGALTDYQRETGWQFQTWEKDFLMELDLVLRHPEVMDEQPGEVGH